jgi:SAM-dependent methyltransferase
MNETDIQSFWQIHPCGEKLVPEASFRHDVDAFLKRYDAYRYTKEAHILECLDAIDFSGRQTLEIGLGQGADAEQIIRRGASWSGVDLTPESIERVRMRLQLRGLPHRELRQASVLALPFPDRRFDIVFSHGVLHHVPDVHAAQREIHRVLRPDGRLIVMLYAKYSLNYLLAIAVVRRAALLAAGAFGAIGRDPGGMVGQHLDNARRQGWRNYLSLRNFVHANTDGPLNPYSKVYDLRAVRRDFPLFDVAASYKRFMHAPPLPVARLPLQRWLGWHLWVHLKPKAAR